MVEWQKKFVAVLREISMVVPREVFTAVLWEMVMAIQQEMSLRQTAQAGELITIPMQA